MFRVLATGLRFPEGPVCLKDGRVLVVEVAGGALTRLSPRQGKSSTWSLGGGPNGAAIGPDGGCYVCDNGGMIWIEDSHGLRPAGQPNSYVGGSIQRVDLSSGSSEVVWGRGRGPMLRGPNDLVFDEHGGLWFTDLGKARSREIDKGAVYYCAPGCTTCDEVIFPMLTPNGIGLSPRGDILYVAETATSRIWRFQIESPGVLRREPYPSPHGGSPLATLSGYRRPDSIAIEECGNICVATLGEGGITVISPQGELVDFVELPDSHVTNICFGGDDMRTAFITLSGTGQLISMDWPRPGLRLPHQRRAT